MENEWESVEDFLEALGTAHDIESRIVRETELERIGGYCQAVVHVEDGAHSTDVFVDRLGRVVMPGRTNTINIVAIDIDGRGSQKVLTREPRYRGDELASWVLYLEPLEVDDV